MLVFLCDSIGVLSRPTGNGATPEINLRLWWLYFFCSYIPLNPNWNNYVTLAWNVCQSSKSLVDDTPFNQASVKPRWAKSWTILPEVLNLLSMNKVYVESWSSTSVSPIVVADTTTLQNFVLAFFGASLPTFHNALSCFIRYSSFSVLLAQRQLVNHIQSIPLTSCSPRIVLVVGWAASPWKLCISRG